MFHCNHRQIVNLAKYKYKYKYKCAGSDEYYYYIKKNFSKIRYYLLYYKLQFQLQNVAAEFC